MASKTELFTSPDTGQQYWVYESQFHKITGPHYKSGPNLKSIWVVNGYLRTFDAYCKDLNLSEEDILMLKLKYET